MGRSQKESGYLKKLFDPDRLRARRETFKKITIPSIRGAMDAAEGIKIEVHVLTSSLLPELDKRFLSDISKEYDFVRVFYMEPDSVDMQKASLDYVAKLKNKDVVASIRLDDDDAVSKDYLKRLSVWMNLDLDEFVVSMSRGCAVLLDKKLNPISFEDYPKLLIAAGLAYVYKVGENSYKNIYSLGSHTKVYKKVPVIWDNSGYSFVRSFHEFNDSRDSFDKLPSDRKSNLDLSAIKKMFEIL